MILLCILFWFVRRDEYMPDITMCASKDCPERNNCYRSCAKPSEFQSWSNFEYTCNEENGFKDFIKCYKKG